MLYKEDLKEKEIQIYPISLDYILKKENLETNKTTSKIINNITNKTTTKTINNITNKTTSKITNKTTKKSSKASSLPN